MEHTPQDFGSYRRHRHLHSETHLSSTFHHTQVFGNFHRTTLERSCQDAAQRNQIPASSSRAVFEDDSWDLPNHRLAHLSCGHRCGVRGCAVTENNGLSTAKDVVVDIGDLQELSWYLGSLSSAAVLLRYVVFVGYSPYSCPKYAG